jgi:hypothetical protein
MRKAIDRSVVFLCAASTLVILAMLALFWAISSLMARLGSVGSS